MRPADKPPACEGCPAYRWGVGYVPPEGPLDAALCVVGQGPGEMEARFSRPFFPEAPSGRELNHWLNSAGWQRSDTLITNTVWCWLPKEKPNGVPQGSRDPEPEEVAYCAKAHLFPLLERADLLRPSDRIILTVGAPATRALLGVDKVDKYIGTFNQRDLRGRVAGPADGGTASPGSDQPGPE